MLKFLRGSPEDLEGRVTIFSRILDERVKQEGLPQFIGEYIVTNPDDLLADPNVNQEMVDRIKADIKQYKDKLKENDPENKIIAFPKLIKPIEPFNEEHEALARPGDVIYTGEYITLQMVIRANEACRELYLLRYNSIELQKRLLQKENPIETKREHDSYSTVEKQRLKPYVLVNFIEPMMATRKNGTSAQNLELKAQMKDFVEFFKDSLFTLDVLEVVKIIDSPKMVDRELVYAYVDKISAINQENFELAGDIAQRIKQCRG